LYGPSCALADDDDDEAERLLSRGGGAESLSSFPSFLNKSERPQSAKERKKHAFGLQGTTECKTRDRTRVGEGEKGREGRRWGTAFNSSNDDELNSDPA
jgi:hypothetical protein